MQIFHWFYSLQARQRVFDDVKIRECVFEEFGLVLLLQEGWSKILQYNWIMYSPIKIFFIQNISNKSVLNGFQDKGLLQSRFTTPVSQIRSLYNEI